MQKLPILILTTLLLTFSCKPDEAPLPVNKMAGILADLHMAESYAQLKPVDRGGYMTKDYDTLLVLYGHIYGYHRTDSTDFRKALAWYKKNPKEFDKVYEQVLNELSIRKEAYTDSMRKSKDSLSVYNDSTQVIRADTSNQKIRDSLKD